MGTSKSSDGPGGGVPFDPPWLDDIEIPQPGEGQPIIDHGADDDGLDGPLKPQPKPANIAPPRRFANARRALREFARTGRKDAFKKAVGHYSRTGMGGAQLAAQRMRTSARSGANVFNVLHLAHERTDAAINEWVNSLTARNASAQDVADEIVRHAIPTGGSQDEASCQQSMAQALEDLLEGDPTVDLFNLGDDKIWELIESFLSYEAFNRMCLDIGQVFEDSSLTPRSQVTRMKEMRDYLKAELHAQVEVLRTDTHNAASGELQSILQNALQNTFTVYEGAI